MHKPIAVFDAGIGSYAIVAEIHKRLPTQDILYFADRASFPYGSKGPEQLTTIMRKTIEFLESFDPSAIVIASNAPSIMVLEDVRPHCSVPLYGVFPPLAEALAGSKSGHVGIMGVRSLIESNALADFVQSHAVASARVALINASSMVELVENGSFLFSPKQTQVAVTSFVNTIFRQYPSIDTVTLSSTHLTWLSSFFEEARPNCRFLDPAEKVVTALGQGTTGSGKIQGLVTEDATYDLETFRQMLGLLGVDIPLKRVT